MNSERISISDFERNDHFYGSLDLLLTVKSFDLQAIRKRYLESKKNTSGKAGSVERREAGLGGICRISLENGQVRQEEVLKEMKEPRGIAYNKFYFGIAAEDRVYIFDKDQLQLIHNPWFSYIHTLDFHEHRLLVASSGLDCLFEYDLNHAELIRDWCAWEHGFDRVTDPKSGQLLHITRIASVAEQWEKESIPHLFIQDPQKQKLPTAMRAAFINSVVFDNENYNNYLATFFHHGAIYRIHMPGGEAECVLKDLKNPHGGNNFDGKIMATSTAQGEIVIGSQQEQKRYSFNGLEGKEESLSDSEWLQNSHLINGNFITIDSNRTSFVIWNPEKRIYSMIPYNNNWAVQDLCQLPVFPNLLERIRQL